MESNKILKADVLDIIFENQNKQYGAYELRKNYHRRARKSVTIVAIFAIVVSAIPLLAGLFMPDERVHGFRHRNVQVLENIPTTPTHPPITPPPSNHHNVQPHTPAPPVVTQTEKMHEDERPDTRPENGPTGPLQPEGPGDGPVALQPGPATGNPQPVIEEPAKKAITYETEALQQFPEFPGGEDALAAFLKSNLKYPKRAIEAGENGKVTLVFVVDIDGTISEIGFLRKAGFGFDEEAKRVVGMMPNWKPGKINGEPVKARYQIPIQFELED